MEAIFQKKASILNSIRNSNLDNSKMLKMQQKYNSQNNISTLPLIFLGITSMMGCGLLLFPILYQETGLVTSQIVISVVCYFSYKTAELYYIHCRNDEDEQFQVVDRIIGPRWKAVYCAMAGFHMTGLILAYYQFIQSILYNQIGFFYNLLTSDQIISKEIFTFSSFSFQYTGIIVFLIYMTLINIRNIDFIINLGKVSGLGLFIFVMFACKKGISNYMELANNQQLEHSKFLLFSRDFGPLAAICCVGFNLHIQVVSILKMNRNKKTHIRNLKTIFIGTYILYSLLGVLGYISIFNKIPKIMDPKLYIDYLPSNLENTLLELLILVKFITVSPFFIHIARQNFYSIFTNDVDSIGFLYNQLFNCTLLITAFMLSFYGISAKKILGSSGAVIGFMVVHYIPIKLHFKCLFNKNCNLCIEAKKQNQALLHVQEDNFNQFVKDSQENKSSSNNISNQFLEINHNLIEEKLLKKEKYSDCAKFMDLKTSKNLSFVYYGVIVIFGVYCLYLNMTLDT